MASKGSPPLQPLEEYAPNAELTQLQVHAGGAKIAEELQTGLVSVAEGRVERGSELRRLRQDQ